MKSFCKDLKLALCSLSLLLRCTCMTADAQFPVAARAGKSSIAALLLGLYDPASGEVTLDGTPLTQLDQRWLRRRIGSVAQEPALLSGTVRDIIHYAVPDASQVRPARECPVQAGRAEGQAQGI